MKLLSIITKNKLVRYKTNIPKMKIEMAPVISCTDSLSHQKAANFLANGHIIAVPTDTIYGLACNANCPEAVNKLYSIKGRDAGKPVAICVTSIQDVKKWGHATHLPEKLLHELLPGPVTIVLEKTEYLNNPYLNPTTTRIGIRIPDNRFINDLTKVFNMPVALTSANFSNEPSTLSVKEFKHLYSHLGAVFDGGVLSHGLDKNRTGSTVIDLSKSGYFKIIRKGISYDRIIGLLNGYGLHSRE